MESVFDKHQPKPAALILQQQITGNEVMVKCEVEGNGADVVHMLTLVLTADDKENGQLRHMIMDALEISASEGSADMKLRVHKLKKEPQVVN